MPVYNLASFIDQWIRNFLLEKREVHMKKKKKKRILQPFSLRVRGGPLESELLVESSHARQSLRSTSCETCSKSIFLFFY